MTQRFLASQRHRILRAVSRFDEASNEDVRQALDIEADRSNRISCELRILRSRGLVEMVSGGQGSVLTRYRVTDAGRKALQ